MKKLLLTTVCLFFVFALNACKIQIQPASQTKNVIAASIFPLADITKNIVQEKMDVITVLPAGVSPHTYDLSVKDLKNLSRVKTAFYIGHGLDNYLQTIAAAYPLINFKEVSDNILLRQTVDQEEAADGFDPHYWLNIDNAKQIAENIYQTVVQIDPANQIFYQDNLMKYTDNLTVLDQEIKNKLAPYKEAALITFHDAWYYFAAEYDLKILASIEPFAGKTPTAAYIKNIVDLVRKYQVKALFLEPQLDSNMLAGLAADENLRIYTLDPVGGVAGRENYIKLMRYNAQIIADAFSQ